MTWPYLTSLSRKRRLWLCISLLMMLVYVGSFLQLSRPAIAITRRQNARSYWFAPPTTLSNVRFHRFCSLFYLPLIVLDGEFGSGYVPARCAGFGLED